MSGNPTNRLLAHVTEDQRSFGEIAWRWSKLANEPIEIMMDALIKSFWRGDFVHDGNSSVFALLWPDSRSSNELPATMRPRRVSLSSSETIWSATSRPREKSIACSGGKWLKFSAGCLSIVRGRGMEATMDSSGYRPFPLKGGPSKCARNGIHNGAFDEMTSLSGIGLGNCVPRRAWINSGPLGQIRRRIEVT